MTDELHIRIGDRTHGATLSECEQWAEEVRLKDEYIAKLVADIIDYIHDLNKAHQRVDNAEAENEALKKTYKKIQEADSPALRLPVAMTCAMAEMTDLLLRDSE